MIGVLTHHWAKADKVDEARKLLDRNGEAQSKAPGFVNRQTLYALTDPTKVTTLVVWTSNDIYDAWRASPARAAAMSGAEAMWSKPPESERFEVASTKSDPVSLDTVWTTMTAAKEAGHEGQGAKANHDSWQ